MNLLKPIEIDFLPPLYTLPPLVQQLTDFFHLPHIVGPITVGQLPPSSTQPDGTAWFGTSNSTKYYLQEFDHTSGVRIALEDGYRTGDYVIPTLQNGQYVATMDAHLQDGRHNEQGARNDRSAAKVDLTFDFGTGGPHDGQIVVSVNGNNLTLGHLGANWFLANSQGTPVQGLTISPNKQVLADSMDLAFVSAFLQHGTNPADISPQDVHIAVTEMVGTVGVMQISETLHLV